MFEEQSIIRDFVHKPSFCGVYTLVHVPSPTKIEIYLLYATKLGFLAFSLLKLKLCSCWCECKVRVQVCEFRISTVVLICVV